MRGVVSQGGKLERIRRQWDRTVTPAIAGRLIGGLPQNGDNNICSF